MYTPVRVLSSSLLVAVLAGAAHAERLPLKTYSVADGLGSDRVLRIARDSRGFLWFATGEGLSRFDGYAFVNYGVAQGLPAAEVADVAEARDGAIWAATPAGVARLDPLATTHPLFTATTLGEGVIDQNVFINSVLRLFGL